MWRLRFRRFDTGPWSEETFRDEAEAMARQQELDAHNFDARLEVVEP